MDQIIQEQLRRYYSFILHESETLIMYPTNQVQRISTNQVRGKQGVGSIYGRPARAML